MAASARAWHWASLAAVLLCATVQQHLITTIAAAAVPGTMPASAAVPAAAGVPATAVPAALVPAAAVSAALVVPAPAVLAPAVAVIPGTTAEGIFRQQTPSTQAPVLAAGIAAAATPSAAGAQSPVAAATPIVQTIAGPRITPAATTPVAVHPLLTNKTDAAATDAINGTTAAAATVAASPRPASKPRATPAVGVLGAPHANNTAAASGNGTAAAAAPAAASKPANATQQGGTPTPGATPILVAATIPIRTLCKDQNLSQACNPAASPAPAPGGDDSTSKSGVVVLLHFNDWHIRMEPCNDWLHAICDKWQDQKGVCGGGIARMKRVVDDERAKAAAAGQPLLLLNAGDDFIGTVWDRKLGLDAPAHFLNLLQPDVMAIGNHEWDRGKDKLKKYLQQLKYPTINCNLDYGGDDLQHAVQPYLTKYVGGHKICIASVTTTYIDDMDIRPIKVLEPISSAQKCVADMRDKEGCNAVVLLTHVGYSTDVYMAPRIPGVDLIVGGHSHSFLWSGKGNPVYDTTRNQTDPIWGAYPTWVDSWSDKGRKVAVVQAGWGSRWIGRLELKFGAQSGKLEGISGYPLLVGGPKSDRPVEEDADVKKQVAEWRYW